ncbi:MAG: hypothetical protein AABX24_05695, partial [Nanoarchaeota archaeon]
VILHHSPKILRQYMKEIDTYLTEHLDLELHPEKSKIIPLSKGTEFLGMRIFLHHKLIKEKNLRKFYRKINSLYIDYDSGLVNYDTIYDSLEGWSAYANNANTYKLKKRILQSVEDKFSREISTKEINRLTRNERKRKRKKK